jgi:hypothetical protein
MSCPSVSISMCSGQRPLIVGPILPHLQTGRGRVVVKSSMGVSSGAGAGFLNRSFGSTV